ncbi:MAG: super-infection exclusion protein B [Planctomycetota bacterium]
MDASAGLTKILDVLKLSATPALAVAFACGVLLFGGDALTATLGMTEVMPTIRPWVGAGFVVAVTLLFAFAATGLGRWIKKRHMWFVNERRLQRQLHRLAPDEQEVLARFLLERRKCLTFDVKDGLSQGLAAAKILFRWSSVGDAVDGFDFSIQPWAWTYLNKHPELVIKDPAKLTLLAERTAISDMEGFDEGRAPWNDDDHGMPRMPWDYERDKRRWRRSQ